MLFRSLEGFGQKANGLIAPANEFWHNAEVKGFEYDFEAAVEELKAAGYEWDENGKLYYPEGKSDQDKDKGIVREVE